MKRKGADENHVFKVLRWSRAHYCAKDTIIGLISNRKKSLLFKSTTVYKLSQEKTNSLRRLFLEVEQNWLSALHYNQARQALRLTEL